MPLAVGAEGTNLNNTYVLKRLADVQPVVCPCGSAQRVLTGEDNDLISVHRVKISKEAKKHYHKRLTETYVILLGSGEMELNDDRVSARPGDVIMIPPLTRHVAHGNFEIINIVCPPFDPDDEIVIEDKTS